MPVVGDTFLIQSPTEWAAVSSPVRFEMVEYLRMLAPCSLAELGQAMARPPDSLYHHMRILTRTGLVIRSADRIARGRAEAVYDFSRRQFRFDIDPPAGRNIKPVQRLTASLCRMSGRALHRAFDARLPVGTADAKQIWARFETAWLDDAALAQANAHLTALDALFDRGRSQRRGTLFQLSFYLSPVVRHERAARTPAAKPSENRRGPRKSPTSRLTSTTTNRTTKTPPTSAGKSPAGQTRKRAERPWIVPKA